jgi:DNA-binding NarL/FixJ family response regulator
MEEQQIKVNEEKQEPVLIQYIRDRVENKNKNFVMLFVGATGSGKSISALRLAEMLDPSFNIDRVNFKAKDFMNTINKLVERSEQGEVIKGKVIMWDEFGVEHNAREFMTISNRVINYFFQTSRHLNLIVIMTVPLLSFIDSSTRKLSHAVAEMQGINSRDKVATVRVKMLQTNVMTGKEYPKYLRYRRKNKSFVSKRIKFHLPSKELIEQYEKKKKEFTTQLNKEIMQKLLKSEEKDNKTTKDLTDKQKEVLNLLRVNSAEQVAERLNISIKSAYEHKKAIEKKGISFKAIWRDKHIVGHDIEGFEGNSPNSPSEPHISSSLLGVENQEDNQ